MSGAREKKEHLTESKDVADLNAIYRSIGHGKITMTGSTVKTVLYPLSSKAKALQGIIEHSGSTSALLTFLKSKVSGNYVAKEEVLTSLIQAKEKNNKALNIKLQELPLDNLKQAFEAFHKSASAMIQLG